MTLPTRDDALEFVIRAMHSVHSRGVWSANLVLKTRYYRGGDYEIAWVKSTGTIAIYYRRPGSAPMIYKMTGDGGPGFIPKFAAHVPTILKSMRQEMVLDDLACI